MTNQKFSRIFSAAILCGLFLLFMWSSAFAQTGTSTVRGTVADQQGRVIPGATLTLSNPEKNFTRTQVSDDNGNYVFSAVPPGKYRVDAEATGFKKATVNDVSALVDTPVKVDVALEAGNISETVSVSASTEAPLNTTDASIGNAIESRRIEELPLNARNIPNLLSLQPGVTQHGEVNGARRDQSNITLDGVDVNEQQSGLDIVQQNINDVNDVGLDTNALFTAFASVLRTTPDSVQEFRVTTSVPNANQGRSSGGQVSLVTKSGSNEWHGTLFEFHRDNEFTSNDFFNNAAGRFTAADPEVISGQKQVGDLRVGVPKLVRNLFGGAIGGPIVKNKFYFFYDYEERIDRSEKSVLRTVPTATLRNGIVRFENEDGGITTLTPGDIAALYPATGGVNPIALAALQTAPLPNIFNIGDGLNTAGFRFNAAIPSTLHTHIARFDFVPTDRQTLFLRLNDQYDTYGLPPAFPTTTAPSLWVHPYGFVAGHTWTLSNSLVNNARFGLTRQAFTTQGDASATQISFRFVYDPFLFTPTVSRTTPVWNFTDDVSWIKGSHTLQFGTNMRWIRNNRISNAVSFDVASTNPSFYANSGDVLLDPLTGVVDTFDTKSAIAAVLGRFSDYSVNANFDKSGAVLPVGTPSARTFATEEYEFYGQDTWKVSPSFTLTYGLRWGVGTPVHEINGFEVKPNLSLGDLFERRQAGAAVGRPVNDLITVNLSGKANNGPPLYNTDWNNFAPLVGFAWTPNFNNAFGRFLGRDGKAVIRGGFRMVYDRVGSQLAVTYDLNNALGFSSSSTIPAGTFNTTTRLPPLFTGFGQDVRTFPFLGAPEPLHFPLTFPDDGAPRIEQSIDDTLTTPVEYTWNLSFGRELPKGFAFEVSYTGRAGRKLLLARDALQFNNLRDPRSGQSWYEAAGILADLHARGVPFDSPDVPRIPFFENLFTPQSIIDGFSNNIFFFDISGFYPPGLTASQVAYSYSDPNFIGLTDWTLLQFALDDESAVIGPNAFIHPQLATFGVLSSVGRSDYHGVSLSLRQRFKDDVTFDFNYTFSKSNDDTSILQANTILGNLVRQPFDLSSQYAPSDFDVRHNINADWVIGLPFGRGKKFFSDMSGVANGILGGWQLSGVARYHSGLVAGQPFDVGFWATNWQLTSNGVRIRPVNSDNLPDVGGSPNIFADPLAAYRSYRNARAGEPGERNTLRIPAYFSLDLGLSKEFKMWYSETHKIQFRWEVFNVTNTQPLGVLSNLSLNQDPNNPDATGPAADFGQYVGSQLPVGEPRPGRVMQFALRYVF